MHAKLSYSADRPNGKESMVHFAQYSGEFQSRKSLERRHPATQKQSYHQCAVAAATLHQGERNTKEAEVVRARPREVRVQRAADFLAGKATQRRYGEKVESANFADLVTLISSPRNLHEVRNTATLKRVRDMSGKRKAARAQIEQVDLTAVPALALQDNSASIVVARQDRN
ncbi:uncharacterized protein CCR75_000112 [Bremia lactucae]|uniref:Uncharacterized protein n=1 Tax=Bremia lactucae TaxID=4779 RepID=A0A976IIM3_BRELC|nr:hypothetical protein CCR75_000112 [Bremia lactucae]